ncbi:hypothetical protein [Rubrolithibacter danxiaensis]|uniref:hypothetical protein n=1 Tax=Rubrolithibacter danxiaensis TaxID=3390805 RepID=UPI003BF80219
MSERLENFIRNNKRDFDEFEPPADLWNKIEEKLNDSIEIQPKHERVIKLSSLIKVAAMLLIVLTAGFIFFNYEKKQAIEISNIDPKLAKQQMHYASLIQQKRQEIQQIEKEDPQLFKEFSSEIKSMDVNYQKLKNDLSTSPNQEETVKAMIRNLQIQLQVLNQQLKIIEQVNQLKQSKNETQSI